MRIVYLLAAFWGFCQGLQAQTTAIANFSFTIHPSFIVSFTNTSQLPDTAGRRAVWLFGDGTREKTLALLGTKHQYAGPGTYTVCLKIYRYNENRTDSVVVADVCKTLVLQTTNTPESCKADFEVGANASSPLKRTLVAQPWHSSNKRPERICWTFGDGRDTCITYNPDQANNYAVVHEYTRPGEYKTCMRIQYAGGCVSENCRAVQVGTTESCTTDFKIEPVSVTPMARTFTALPQNNLQRKPLRICWTFGDGHDTCVTYTNSFTGPYNVRHTYTRSGDYKVCTRVVYDGGCVAEMCKAHTVAQPPAPGNDCGVKASEVAAANNLLERRFYATLASGQKAERICWSFGDGRDTCYALSDPPTTQSLTIGHRYPAPGVYRLTVSVWYSGGCMAHAVKEVDIRSGSSLCGAYISDSLVAPGVYGFRGFGIVGPNDRVSSYHWTFGDGSSSTGPQATHKFAGGTYQVCLLTKTEKGCEAKVCKTLVVPSSQAGVLQVTPNLVLSELHVLFQSTQPETVTISIFNANGVLVRSYTRSAVAGANKWAFDVAGLPKGVYSVVVHSASQLASTVFIKQ
jgi:PKD repeat protein